MKTVIIIPARMASIRFPNKPLALINGIPMIQRVWEQAIKSDLDTHVACSEIEVYNLIKDLGGSAIMTDPNLPSGTDRVFEALKKIKNYESYQSIINLQGDMPLINPKDIIKANKPITKGFDIGTLATDLSLEEEKNINITKVKVELENENGIGKAENFYKNSRSILKNIYHHVGVYSFKIDVLEKFVSIKPTINELKQKLEQLRALDSGMSIGVSYLNNVPISVDTKEDLIHLESIIKINNDKS